MVMAFNLLAMAFYLLKGAPPGSGGGEGAECRGLKVT